MDKILGHIQFYRPAHSDLKDAMGSCLKKRENGQEMIDLQTQDVTYYCMHCKTFFVRKRYENMESAKQHYDYAKEHGQPFEETSILVLHHF